jgi:hypothetical protein
MCKRWPWLLALHLPAMPGPAAMHTGAACSATRSPAYVFIHHWASSTSAQVAGWQLSMAMVIFGSTGLPCVKCLEVYVHVQVYVRSCACIGTTSQMCRIKHSVI